MLLFHLGASFSRHSGAYLSRFIEDGVASLSTILSC
jgi:hypothetical protein